MRRARLEGLRIGRRPLDVDRAAIVRDRLLGASLTDVARKHGVSRATVCRLARVAGGQAEGAPPGPEPPPRAVAG